MAHEERVRASAVCEAEGHLLLVRLRDPVSSVEGLFPPGGGVEPGEVPADAASRETREETGLRVRVIPTEKVVATYPFRWAGVDYDVTTHFFAASLEGAFAKEIPAVVDADFNLGASWVEVAEAHAAMSVHPEIASAVLRVLRLAWRRHPNAHGPASLLLEIHEGFRVAAERLALHVAGEPTLDHRLAARMFRPLAQTLHHHHHAEEAMLFPMMARRTGATPDRLLRDHQALTAAIAAVDASLASSTSKADVLATVAAFREILVAHLDREEALVIPVLLAMKPGEAWSLVHAD